MAGDTGSTSERRRLNVLIACYRCTGAHSQSPSLADVQTIGAAPKLAALGTMVEVASAGLSEHTDCLVGQQVDEEDDIGEQSQGLIAFLSTLLDCVDEANQTCHQSALKLDTHIRQLEALDQRLTRIEEALVVGESAAGR